MARTAMVRAAIARIGIERTGGSCHLPSVTWKDAEVGLSSEDLVARVDSSLLEQSSTPSWLAVRPQYP